MLMLINNTDVCGFLLDVYRYFIRFPLLLLCQKVSFTIREKFPSHFLLIPIGTGKYPFLSWHSRTSFAKLSCRLLENNSSWYFWGPKSVIP